MVDNKSEIYTSLKNSPFRFNASDITIKDDAYHDSKAKRFTEWWYFDAVFDNGYSAQAGVRIMSLLDQDVVIFSRLDIYKDNRLVSHDHSMHFLENAVQKRHA